MLVWLLGFPSTVDAQTVLTGVVHDQEGRIVPGVTVVAVHEATGRRWLTVSSRDGVYQFERLPAGRYQVMVELEASVRFEAKGIEITGLVRVPLDISLVLTAKESLTVQGQAYDTEFLFGPSERPATFSSQDLATLLLPSGRTLQSIQPLAPGVVFTESTGTLAQFSANGQRRFANRLIIDGVGADLAIDVRGLGMSEAVSGGLPATATSGGTQTLVSLESVQEIQVHTTTATSEHARAPGAQTVIVTRSGSDRFSGVAFAGLRPETLAASDWFSNAGLSPKRELHFWNAGGSTGGPIRRGWLNYFATWERQSANRPVTQTIEVPSMVARNAAAPTVRPLLEAFPRPNGRDIEDYLAEYSNTFPVTSRLWALSARADARFAARHHVFARMNRGTSAGDALGSAPLQNPFLSYASRESAVTTTLTAGWTTTLGAAATNDFRANVSSHTGEWRNSAAPYGDTRELPNADYAASDSANTWLFATLFPGPFGSVSSGLFSTSSQRQVQFANALSLVRGRHAWRLGFDYSQSEVATDGASTRYQYRFGSITALLQGRPVQATLTRVVPAGLSRQSWSGFVQDAFRATTRLTIDYGLRYSVQPAPRPSSSLQPLLLDFESLPAFRARPSGSPFWNTYWGRFAPRVGAAYRLGSPDEETGTVIRGSSGVVFDDLTSPGGTVLGRGYPYVTGRQSTVPKFPALPQELVTNDIPEPFAAGDVSEYFSFPADLRSPRIVESQIGLDHSLDRTQRLSVTYVEATGEDLVYWFGYPSGTSRLAVNAYSNDATSAYRALSVEYVKRLSNDFHARGLFTWSRSRDTDSGERLTANAPPTLVDPSLNVGPSDFDRPCVLSINAGYRLPQVRQLPSRLRPLLAGWQIDVALAVRSGALVSVEDQRNIGVGSYLLRADAVPDAPVWIKDATSPGGRRLNPDAFRPSSEPRQGTSTRNSVRTSPLQQLDLALSRSFRVARMTVQLRAEAFNVLNHPTFGPPEALRASPAFGRPFQSHADAMGTGTLARGGLAPLQQVGGPRSLQFTIRWGM